MDGRNGLSMVAINLLKQMGWISPTVAETLAENLVGKRLEVVGELSML